jgi:hypothetical protein
MNQTWPLRVAAKAADTTPRTVRRWLDHNIVRLRNNDVRPNGSGHYCGLSRNRILQIAITHRLLAAGMSLSLAATGALQFTDAGQPGREPGQPFEFGKTILVIDAAQTRVVNADFDAGFADLINHAPSAVILDVNQLVDQVGATLF